MKAYVYGANGAEIADVAKPSPKGTQVLVKVHACGLNRADLGMTKGHAHGAPAASAPCSAWNGPAKSPSSGRRPRASRSATRSWAPAARRSRNIRWPITAGCFARPRT